MIAKSLLNDRKLLGVSGLVLAIAATLLIYGALGPGFNTDRGGASGDTIGSEDLRTGARQGFISRESDLPATDFTLTDQHGDQVSLSQFEGKWVVMTWIYLSCKTVCPALTGEMKQLQETFREELGLNIQLVSLTFDPERDTQSAMLSHAQGIRADVPGWSWLTGSRAQTDAIAEAYGFAYEEVEMPGMAMDGAAAGGEGTGTDGEMVGEMGMAMDEPGDEMATAGGNGMDMDHEVHFDHTALVVVVNPDGDEAYRYFGIGWAGDLATTVAAEIAR